MGRPPRGLEPAHRFEVRPDFEVIVDGGAAATVRAPDLVLAAPDLPDAAPRIHARDAMAVVEILSPGSRRLDRVLKLHEYAEAGVPFYLLVEPGPPVLLTEFGLVDGTYHQVAEHAGTAALELGVRLDLAALDA